MDATVLTAALGAFFVVLGRWLYRNPTGVVPKWGILNREHPGLKRFYRAYAIFLIFFGLLAAAAAVVHRLVPGSPAVLVALVVAVAGTWLLRPRLDSTSIESGLGPGQIPEKQPLLNAHWKRTVGIFTAIMAVAAIAIPMTMGDSDVAKLAFTTAQANPAIKQRLGEPVKKGLFSSGSIQISGPSGHADLEIPISGPKGKATVYAVATKSIGLWKLDILEAEFKGSPERVDLLKQPTNLEQPLRR